MSLPDEFLKGLSRHAVTIITLLGSTPAVLTIAEIKAELPWMKAERVDKAMKELLARPLLLRVQASDGVRYGID